MMHYVNLSQRINDNLTSFLTLYPMYQEYRKEILEATEKRMSQRQHHVDRCTFEENFMEYQLGVDITVEITKAAMLFKATTESTENKAYSTYNQQGKVTSIPLTVSYFV